ncbi:MAG: molybdopterin-dependent oxidoreductase [Candidatus Jettenia sp. CY-1]|nr:MAG: molybdopterin-dependent oxidoreductase [Candidatus Jettenia sp. CY-1]
MRTFSIFGWFIISLFLLTTSSLVEVAQAQEDPCPGGYSKQFRLSGRVENPRKFRLADLQQYPKSSHITVSSYSGSKGLVTKTYIGVPLIDLLNDAVIITDSTRKNDILRKYVAVKATDCYEVVISVAELLSNFGHQQVLVAFATGDGQPLDDTEGMARLIVPGDKSGGRFVSNITAIRVRSAPQPIATIAIEK